MRALSFAEMLSVWERGWNRSPLDQALLILSAAQPDLPATALEEMSIGQRDRELLELLAQTFGPKLACRADCPQCNEELEFALDVSQLRNSHAEADQQPLTATVEECEIRYRTPNSEDLRAVAGSPDLTEARRQLVLRCITRASQGGVEKPVKLLPDTLTDHVSNLIVRADPQLDTQVEIRCPACSHAWSASFDIGSYFWSELSAWARRSLWEVHALASAYGWSEADVLAMGPVRRHLYLEMAHG